MSWIPCCRVVSLTEPRSVAGRDPRGHLHHLRVNIIGNVGRSRNGESMRLGTLILMVCGALVSVPAHAQSPLDRAHAHNDYQHARPLLDALDRGFGSIEADIYLINGALLVAHERDSVRADRTLEALYLAPLRAWIEMHGGRVNAGRPPLTLLIDVKSHADSTWAALEPLLRRYDDVIASWHGDSMTTRPVIAVISGERPRCRW